jgi:mevalonate kinase
MALAVPYSLFEGKLTFPRDKSFRIDSELKAFCQYLKKLDSKEELLCPMDLSSFEFDIGQGLFFDSSIPQGYGVGSSGAVVASIFENYKNNSNDNLEDISYLKSVFSQMESHFHGSSSGADPLISYMNAPILIDGKTSYRKVEIPKSSGDGAIFLLNTGRPRRTEPLVNLFLEKCKADSFSNLCDNVLAPITNNCINSFLSGDKESLFEFFRELSDFQFRHFGPMIPTLYNELWENGLKYENFYLKLCGAGGGGFLLGMTPNIKEAMAELDQYEIRPLYRF